MTEAPRSDRDVRLTMLHPENLNDLASFVAIAYDLGLTGKAKFSTLNSSESVKRVNEISVTGIVYVSDPLAVSS